MTDYLDNDDPINGQKYVCLSILTNKSIKDVSSGEVIKSDNNAKGIKIRGVYNTMEDAKKRCEQIRQFDKVFNVFVGEVGSWLPWDDDPESAEEAVYAEEKLNQMMKSFKEQQVKAKEFHELRKQQQIEQSIKSSQAKDDDKSLSDDKDLNNIIEDNIKDEKEGLNEYKNEINDKEKHIKNINTELEKARKIIEIITKKSE
jgi:Family of unknown function (DUF5832)